MESKISKLFFPKGFKCLVCGKEIEESKFEICDECYEKLPFIKGKVCLSCGEPIHSDSNYCLFCKKEQPKFKQCFSPFRFEGEIVDLIYNLKYDGQKYVANTLSNFMLKHFLYQNIKVDLVVPVPLHLKRENKRGFNQSFLLCKAFIDAGFNVDNSSVLKVKNTKTQTFLSKQERKENSQNAFKVVNKFAIKNKTILIVDDVYTTGATFNSLTETLLKAGAKQVYGLTCAHTILEK